MAPPYHGGWTTSRLAAYAGIDETAMRKRLQQIRDKLRREIEFAEQILPEILDLSAALKSPAGSAMYITPTELHRVDADRILRYDLTLPLLMTVRYEGKPVRIWSTGKAYRLGQIDATHLEALHQAEVYWLDARTTVDPWTITGKVMQSINHILPGRSVRIAPTDYPMCTQAWELSVDDDGYWLEVVAWGVFQDAMVAHVGANPATHTSVGIGYGLERLAMARYGIDDIRKIDVARVA
ncbi:MAG: hypothetical protein DMF90_21110 [Acidobacteria bacterium]|nr:MAG: hypothetical protein DMF90_21110 [Acidobacteriota bacterium]